jgi:EAL domain-containing protein (putative c-di-GMP-specific phosphodiesterase class I)
MQYTCICSVLHLNNKNAAELLDHGIEAIHGLRLSKGKNAAAIFTPSAKEVAALSSNDIDNIDEAIEHGLVKLLYQPLMSLQGRIKENYEVTVWLNDKGQNVYPTEMIKNAKNSKLDRWIILESTKALALHRAAGHPTRMIINLTANGLLDDGLATWLKVATKAANLTHDLIIFQFDEEDIRNNLKAAIKTINALHDNKFLVACRHFGKDAEPFKLLNHLKLDLIRFDASFTASVLKGDSASLKELIRKAKEAQIETVIPDVDNASALATLWQLGTHYVQGSYVQLPTPVMNHEFTELG